MKKININKLKLEGNRNNFNQVGNFNIEVLANYFLGNIMFFYLLNM